MDIEEALELADDLTFTTTGQQLDSLQKSILRGAWDNQKYREIAQHNHRSEKYVKEAGFKLWKLLSVALGEDIHKSTFRSRFEKWIASHISNSGNCVQIGNDNINLCGETWQSSEVPRKRSSKTSQNPEPTAKQPRLDLGDAPEILTFYDGLSGIGKTALTLQLIPEIQHEFDYIIYRSLRNCPTLKTLQTNLIKFVSQQQEIELPSLIEHLRSSRCLIILDDLQTIFTPRQLAGHYQPGYENYGTFFKQLAESSHNSCLILLSWEKPREIAALEGENRPCKSLQLNGLGAEAGEIFREKRLAEEEKWSQLIDLYRGNPLWLNIIATMIQDLFGGSVSEFLSYDTLFLGDLESLLHQQCDRLSESEKQVISWLASEAEPVEISKISANLELSPSALLQAVQSLGRRLLIEKVKQGEKTLFTLQPVFIEYVKNQFLKVG
ncbi:MAG: ATPase [Microcoleus sp. PH2017_21_RUC_O_A]|uniref:ATPase n=1 Tax=Microcoleus sp. PH2017_21_RUC_O_A TaxID=2798832 RepID=UPI001D33E5E7|nr:ATPase [Microcoleus sp. PH2017_21_RUC_O_A]MCC3531890.1 ATPase [Microcoleus sp. PH2017_21_RUC_O_A]